jgi:hypothetical protein
VRAAAARVYGALLSVPVSGPVLLGVAALFSAVSGALAPETSPLLVGAIGALLCASFALARSAAVVPPAAAGYGPVVAARDHHRALARRAVPRLRDPDAPGRTRSRAPSGPSRWRRNPVH